MSRHPGRLRPEIHSLRYAMAWLGIVMLTAAACTGGEQLDSGAAEVDDERAATARFWEIYRTATEARTGSRPDEAIRAYRDALGLQPEHADSLHFLAQLLYDRSDVSAARDLLTTLTRTEDHSLRGYQQLSVVHGSPRAGWTPDPGRALELILQAVEWNPGNSGAQALRGRWAAYAGLEEEADEALAAALGHNPREVDGALLSAWRRKPEAAAALLDGLCEQLDCSLHPRVEVARAALEARNESSDRISAGAADTAPRTELTAEVDLDRDGSSDLTIVATAPEVPAALFALDRSRRYELPSAERVTSWAASDASTGVTPSPWRATFLSGPEGPRLVIVGGGEDPVRLFEIEGERWVQREPDGLPGTLFGAVLAAADLVRGDGLTDLLVANTLDPDGVLGPALLAARADGGFEPVELPNARPITAAAAGDVDGDGIVDLVLADEHGVRLLAGSRDGLVERLGMLPALEEPITDIAVSTRGRRPEIYVATGRLSPEVPYPDRLWRLAESGFLDASGELGAARFADTVRVLPDGRGGLRLLRDGLVPGAPRRLLFLHPPR